MWLLASSIEAKIISTVFGDVNEQNQVILELIDSKAMQRLKYIDQSGPEPYFILNTPSFSRYEHSIGVYALLKRYNLTPTEQIAGLLHDASHTVFSHLADQIFQKGLDRTESYQDNIHNWYLQQMHIDDIIAKSNLSTNDISPKNDKFFALEQPYPDMNADRIEYNLHTALVFNDLEQSEIQQILQSLHFENNKWYFIDVKNATKLANLSTNYTKSFWGSAHNAAIYTTAAAAVKYALDKKILCANDLHFGVDQDIVKLLRDNNDPILKKLIIIMENIDDYFIETKPNNFDVHQLVKMRGIDPLVMHNQQLQRLSAVNADFKHELEITQQYAKRGVYLKFKNINDKFILDLLRAANA